MFLRVTGFWILLAIIQPLLARADSTVVFNEIMYHPAATDAAGEWVELYNQMAVDVDMSGWSLDGDIHYKFAPNTIARGGGFVVVAISPTDLAASSGLANVLGPFTNHLSHGTGKLLLRNNNGRVVSEVNYDDKGAWPVAADGSGASLAKIDTSGGSSLSENWTWSTQAGGTPGRENFPTNYPASLRIAFNEVSPATNSDFWLELANYGTNSLSLADCVIVCSGSTNSEYVFPAGPSLTPRGYSTVHSTALGFHPVENDKLFLLSPGRTNVLDAMVLHPGARARLTPGIGRWYTPASPTPGATNNIFLRHDVVINEIMYHHQPVPGTNGLPPQNVPEQWLELYNRSNSAINLTGWHLEGDISFDFPAGKILAPGAYLVIAKDAANLRLLYPGIDIEGDFSGKLAHNDGTIVLDDGADNPVNSVHYYSGGRWPVRADAGGSSLELRNPYADNSRPEAWAPSIESSKAVWKSVSYQGVAQTVVGTDQWNDFILGLLDEGQCLVDDVSVVQSPSTKPLKFVANGNFENGSTGWRFLGTHMQSRVEAESSNPTNHVLHIISGGAQGDQQDHIETTFGSNKRVTNGLTYQISFRAKWLGGNNLLNSRLYYDRVARTTALPVPLKNGTPGARNSVYATNIPPVFAEFQHRPVVPAAGEPVIVSIQAQDPQGVSICEVWWSANGAAFSHTNMTLNAGGFFTGRIPGFSSDSIVQFYVRAVDRLGAVSTYPAAGASSGALYMVQDGQADPAQGHNFRVVLSPANWALLRASTNLLGNRFLPATLIYDERRPYYDISVRLKGSPLGRVGDPHPSFHLRFQPDELFRGTHSDLLLDTSGRPGQINQQEEIIVHHMANHAGGIPDIYQDICLVIPPYGAASSGVAEPRFEDEFISTAFHNGSAGTLFNMELDYYPTTATGGYKNPAPQSLWGTDIKDLGTDKELYRYNFQLKNHRGQDDFSRFIPFARTLALPNGPMLEAQSHLFMDVDEWLRMFALISLVGESDWYTFGHLHNLLMYIRPDDNRVLALPWDVEQVFLRAASSPLIGESSDWTDLEKFYPANTRRLYAHALDIIATTFNTNYMSYWTAHYSSFAPGQDFSELLDYIPPRTAAVQAEIDNAGGNSPFTLTGTDFVVSSNLFALSGTAPITVQTLLLNGIAYPVAWTTISNWSILLPLSPGSNYLSLTALDLNGNPLPGYNQTVTINNSEAPPDPSGSVVINEIQYNPPATGASYVELFNNSDSATFDLSSWRLNGIDYTFPAGAILASGQYLVLVKDKSAFINSYGPTIPVFDEFAGNLQPDGETITLVMPGAQTNQPPVVLDKVKYSAALPWPVTSPGRSLQLIDPVQDRFRPGNWAAATGTPGAINSVRASLPPFAPLWLNELEAQNLTGITNRAGQRTPWLELFNPSTNVVFLTNLYLAKSYTNLTAWAFPAGAAVNPGQFKIIFADGLTNLSTTNELHTKFSLTAGAGSLALSRIYNGKPQVLDFLDYTNLTPNRSFGSFPDAQNFDLQEFAYATPGSSNNGASAPLSVTINEWMAGNTHTRTNPLSGKFSDWFELYNANTNVAYIGGYYLTDSSNNQFKVQIPAGYKIAPRGFLLVWADGRDTNGTTDLHVSFKLNKSGGTIGLYGADGKSVDFLNYGAQSDDVSEGRFPDGGDNRFFMPKSTPRTNNVVPNTLVAADVNAGKVTLPGPPPQLSIARPTGSVLPFSFTTVPGQLYQLQFKTNLNAPAWSPLSAPFTGTGDVWRYHETNTGDSQRFYRLLVLPGAF